MTNGSLSMHRNHMIQSHKDKPPISLKHDIDDQLTYIGLTLALTRTATQRQEMKQVDLTGFILLLLISHNPTETPKLMTT